MPVNTNIISHIFEKTEKITNFWTNYGQEYTENPQTSHILYYLSLTAGYLKGKEEAKFFQHKWNEIKNKLKEGSDEQDWLNQSHMIQSHLEQALKEESVHNPKDKRNPGIAEFYKNKFPELYKNAKKEYEDFQKRQEEMVKAMREHHEYIFSTQERWEEALRNGDPAALCD